MSRPLRIQFEGAWYHFMNRGAGQRQIFDNGKLNLIFLDMLKTVSREHGGNWPRYVAIYLVVELCGIPHATVASLFTKLSVNGVSTVLNRVKKRIAKNFLEKKILLDIKESIYHDT